MDDISTLVWIGVAILWVLTRLIRGGVRKANRELGKRSRRTPAAAAPRDPQVPAAQAAPADSITAEPIEPR